MAPRTLGRRAEGPPVPVRRVRRARFDLERPGRAVPGRARARGPAHAAGGAGARRAARRAGTQAEAAGEQEEKEEEAGPDACGWLRRVHVKNRRRGAPLLPILIK